MNDPGNNPGGADGSQQHTERMPAPKKPPKRGLRARLEPILVQLRDNPIFAIASVGIVGVGLIVLVAMALFGGSDAPEEEKALGTIRNAESSWVEGQTSLVAYDQFGILASRANVLGEDMQAAYVTGQSDLDKARILARKRARERARQRYLEARRRAKREYEAALRRAKEERKRKLAEQKRKIAERLRRLREKHKVEPGEECSIPEVRRDYNCQTGYPF